MLRLLLAFVVVGGAPVVAPEPDAGVGVGDGAADAFFVEDKVAPRLVSSKLVEFAVMTTVAGSGAPLFVKLLA